MVGEMVEPWVAWTAALKVALQVGEWEIVRVVC